ncbi:MAG TPA: VWA domain-containing protein [Blastocatellia bacterium]|nr:VWA domain-containing protein [Blastocatellia bacterium]
MIQKTWAALLLMPALLASFCYAQGPTPAGAQKSSKEEVVRIGVTLVQVDAVVTDSRGRHVTDLKPEDFEILEDGRSQHITNFAYISANTPIAGPEVGDRVKAPDRAGQPLAGSRLKPGEVRRTIALVVDDLTLSFNSAYNVRRTLKKFVDEQMETGDLVAIIRTGGGIGALQQFTSDKRQLNAAIERVRWNPAGSGHVAAFAPIESTPMGAAQGTAGGLATSANLTQANSDLNDFREQVFSVGTLGALNFIVQGLSTLPGRKSVILMSDGISIYFDQNRDNRVLGPLRRLADLANRASVVIYTIDARGLQTLGLTAADEVSGIQLVQGAFDQLEQRRTALFESQQGLAYIADETGGLAIRNSNDLSRAINRVLDDQSGYYLIGYVPNESTFKPVKGFRPFHKISVRVKRAGLRVRSRKGFLGITDEEAALVPRTRSQQLYSAITSPFGAEDISLRLTSTFGNGEKTGSYVFSMLHIDPGHFTFVDDGPGSRKAVFDVLVMAFGDNGVVLGQVNRTETIRVKDSYLRDLLDRGFAFGLTVPVKRPGAYQVRVAVRDGASEKLGSASQFVEVPDVRKGRIVVSDMLLRGKRPRPASSYERPGTQPSAAAGEVQQQSEATLDQADENPAGQAAEDHPAVRRFRPGAQLDLSFIIHNARVDKALGHPNIDLQLRIFKDDKLVYDSGLSPFDAGKRADYSRLGGGASIALKKDMEPGQYSLQVICADMVAKPEHRTATQWIDFEVTR